MNYERKETRNKFLSIFEDVLHYYKNIVIALVICAVLGLGSYFYSSYKVGVNQRAYKAFNECMKYYEAPVVADQKSDTLDIDTISFSSREEKWEKVTSLFHKAFFDHASSSLAPFFKIFESEALLNQHKQTEAAQALAQGIEGIKDTAIKESYSLKLALIQLDDQSNQSQQEQGLMLLKSLAENIKSTVHDAALFNLGFYYWNKHDFDSAKNYWNQLLLTYGADSKNPSPWAEQAKEKLKLISTK